MKVGIQLYSVRNHMAENPLDTIRQVVKTGYRYIEVANHNADKDIGVGFGVPAAAVKALLEEVNASIFSAHLHPLESFLTNDAKTAQILDYHQQIGTKFIVMPMDFYRNRDEVLNKADLLNKIGKKCADAGMELLYHNHFHEFQTFEGESIYSILMDNTDPSLVKIELDTYWCMRGQQNPVELLKKYGKRVRLIHQKDFPKGLEKQLDLLAPVEADSIYVDMMYFNSVVAKDTFTEIGTGIIDIQSIIDTANQYCGSEYIVLEQDYSQLGELQSISVSMESFKKFHGIQW